MVRVAKTGRSHLARGGLSISSNQLCINRLVNVNVCTYEVFIRHMGHAILSLRRNFSVTTDR